MKANNCDLTAANIQNGETVAEVVESPAELKIDLPAATLYDLEEMDFAEPPKERWRIADDSTADWAIRKIAAERAELERIEALAKAEIDRVNEKLEQARRRYENGSSYLTHCLSEYFNTVTPKKQKTQATYQLLSGKLKRTFDKQKMKPDDEKLLHYLVRSGNDDLIKTEEKPRWAEFKQYLKIVGDKVIDTRTGELVDGVEVVTEPGKFSIDF